jgi:hypothetical protein
MPLFKKKSEQDHAGRLQELEAHVKRVRQLSAEEARAPGTLRSFLMEDGHYGMEQEDLRADAPLADAGGVDSPPQVQATPEPPEPSRSKSEDEAMLEAALQRYLARMAGEDGEDGPVEGRQNAPGDFDDTEQEADFPPSGPNY